MILPDWLMPILGIILVDLVLSGDNALIIGAAASALPGRQRTFALILGGVGAIFLRMMLSASGALLMEMPYVRMVGGLILCVIALRLLWERWNKTKKKKHTPPAHNFLKAVLTILVADVTMSLDNVIAVGALASNWPMLVIGLVFSMVILMLGSALVSRLMGRLPFLLDLASVVLAVTAAQLCLRDAYAGSVLKHLPRPDLVLPLLAVLVLLLADLAMYFHWRRGRRSAADVDAEPCSGSLEGERRDLSPRVPTHPLS